VQVIAVARVRSVRGVPVVAIAPDLGERYHDISNPSNWVEDLHGPDVPSSADLSTAHRPG
jgi:hypothetical protein